MISEELVTQTLALGAIVVSIFILAFLISFITKSSGFYARFFKKYGLEVIFIFSLISSVGSLIYQLIWGMAPCDLCWYQRIFMYPIVLISGFALYKGDRRNGAIYTILLSIFGAALGLYHHLLQTSQFLKSSSTFCAPGTANDCSIPEFIHFGFVTFPYLSLTIFVLMLIAGFYASRRD